MTAKELIQKQLDESEYMLDQVFAGLDEASADFKNANLMTARETASHLCECYLAAAAAGRGEKHNWGSYVMPASTWQGVLEEFAGQRAAAISALMEKDDDGALWWANEFIVSHDQYHVGQMCATRLAQDPSWDPYSIYRH